MSSDKKSMYWSWDTPPPEEVERGQEFLVLHSSVLEAVKEGKVWKCSLLPVLCFWEINLLSWLTFFFLHGLVESCGRWQPQTPRLHLISSGLAGTKQFTSISFAFSPRRRVKSCLDLDTFSLVTSICWADGSELQWAKAPLSFPAFWQMPEVGAASLRKGAYQSTSTSTRLTFTRRPRTPPLAPCSLPSAAF